MWKKIILLMLAFSVISVWIFSNPGTFSAFELKIQQEETEKPLKVLGKFPEWLEGSLIRNSAIPIYQKGQQVSHEFDGLAMLHGFAFNKSEVFYTNRFLRSKQYDLVVNQGSLQYSGFASEPTFWEKIISYITPTPQGVNNASVNVFKYGPHYIALTEVPLPACFDLKTLQTLGSFNYQDELPKSDSWESAHPHYDTSSKEIVNYLIEFGYQSYYVVYRIKEGSSSREVIASVPVDTPSYMHSFAMTEHYCVLTEFPLVVNPLDLLIENKPFIHNFTWQPENGTRFTVVERSSGKVVSQMVTDPFFSYHHANAYEVENGIVLDIVAYPDLSSESEIFPQATPSKKEPEWQRRLVRYHLFLDKNEIFPEVLLEKDIEFPRFDDKLDGKKYRYLYMTLSEGSGRGIGKFDLETKEFKTWLQADSQVLEPIFVPSPYQQNEDEGVILTIVYDKVKDHSFLLALDAHSFAEIARADLPWQIPGSFHGQYFSESIYKH